MSEENQIIIACPQCRTEYRVSPGITGKKVTCNRCKGMFTAVHDTVPPPVLPRLAMLAVRYNLITREQLMEVLSDLSQETAGKGQASFESMLLEKGLLSATQLEALKLTELFIKTNQTSQKFGVLAIEKTILTDAALKAALEKQAILFKESKTVRHVKDILLEEGAISKADHDVIVAMSDSVPDKTKPAETGSDTEAASTADVTRSYDLIISEDRMSAALQAKTAQVPLVSPAAVLLLLKSKGITHGIIDEDALNACLSAPKDPAAPDIIARGMPAANGTKAALHYHFATDQRIGTLSTQGKIDFKDKGDVPFVRQGDLLLEKTPAVPGMSGHDIFGTELKPPAPSDIKLLVGPGAQLSEDKLKVTAKADGQPKLSLGGRLSVVTDLVINGDVDLKSGHVDFEGNVKITGTVQSGFRVKGINVTAKEIMGAEITASGSVTTTGGIIGAVVKAQGDIKAKYIKNAALSTFGDVVVQKEITDSNINASGACLLTRGKILSSEISAKQGVEALDIGTDLSAPCKITVGVNDHIEAEMEGLQSAIGRREERLSKIDSEVKDMEVQQQKIHQEIAGMAQVQDRSLVDQRSLKRQLDELSPDDSGKRTELENAIAAMKQKAQEAEDALGNLFDKQDDLTQKTEKLQHQTDQIKDDLYELKHELDAIRHWAKSQKKAASIKVSGSVVQGTVIAGPHTRTIIKDTCRHVTIREVKNTDPDSAVEWEIKLQNS